MNRFFIAQRFCRRRAAIAALVLPVQQHHTVYVWLAWTRSRAGSRRFQGPVKTEGKIKGPARGWPLSQSAHGLGAARRLAACVPRRSANPQGIELGRVPFSMRYACLSWSLCHGIA
jgi:hypothetical protein